MLRVGRASSASVAATEFLVLRRWRIVTGSNLAGSSEQAHFGRMIVAAVQVERSRAPYFVATFHRDLGRPIARVLHRRDVQRGSEMAKAYSIGITTLRVGRRSRWRCVGRALLRDLHEPRTQTARKIIHDYRHLLESEAVTSGRATLPGQETQREP